MVFWAHLVQKESVELRLAVFVDDRSVWTRSDSVRVSADALKALDVTVRFDNRFGLFMNIGKSCIAANNPKNEAKAPTVSWR